MNRASSRSVLLLQGLALAVPLGLCNPTAPAAAQPRVTVAPGSVVRWSAPGTQTCHLGERSWAAIDDSCFLPVDLLSETDLQAMRTFEDGRYEELLLTIGDYPYPVQRLTIKDQSKVDLSAEDLARVERENQRIAALWQREGEPEFTLPLAPPLVPLPEGGRFGSRRFINGQPRSPHTGRDYSAAAGAPVHAAGGGQVALAEDHFFAGKSVFIDHGGGLISMYFHLSEILVEPGESLERGQLIGKVGSTGRSTGPHLHFGLRWQGARVDPTLLLAPPGSLPSAP